jgi:hypothetical protein
VQEKVVENFYFILVAVSGTRTDLTDFVCSVVTRCHCVCIKGALPVCSQMRSYSSALKYKSEIPFHWLRVTDSHHSSVLVYLPILS